MQESDRWNTNSYPSPTGPGPIVDVLAGVQLLIPEDIRLLGFEGKRPADAGEHAADLIRWPAENVLGFPYPIGDVGHLIGGEVRVHL